MAGRLKAAALLVVMFGLGVVSGRAWEMHRINQEGLHHVYAAQRVAWLKKELHLTPVQEEALKQIIEDAHDRLVQVHRSVSSDLADIHEESINDFRDTLTPEQRKKFEQLHLKSHERQAQRERRHEEKALFPIDPADGGSSS